MSEEKRNVGIDPRQVLAQLMQHQDVEELSKKIVVMNLTFGIRQRSFYEDGRKVTYEQKVSIVDLGNGQVMDVYPVTDRFDPLLGVENKEPCFVIRAASRFFNKETQQEEEKPVGYAILVNLREGARKGAWKGLGNMIYRLKFQKSQRSEGGFVARGPNGRKVLVPANSGFEPLVGQVANYMVSQPAPSVCLAHCIVPDEDVKEGDAKKKGTDSKSLVLMAESVGAVLAGVDTFGFTVAGRLYDACQILNLPATATEREVEGAYKKLALTEHPDKKVVEFRNLTGSEPPPAIMQGFNHEWTLIEMAKEKFVLNHLRTKAKNSYLKLGREAMPDLPVQIKVKNLAARLQKTISVVKYVLAKVGYEVKDGKTELQQIIAWTAVGLLASGELNLDELTAAAKKRNDPEQVAVALAKAWGGTASVE